LHNTNNSTNTTLLMRLHPAYAPYGVSVLDVTTTGSAICYWAQVEVASTASALARSTVKAGDIIGVDEMLLMASDDASSSDDGSLTVSLANRPYKAITAGAAVTLQRPTAEFMLGAVNGVPLRYAPGGLASALELQFMEAW
jgi:hypothetical protein